MTDTTLAFFSLEFLNFAPPECVDPDAGFYHKLCIMTSCPFLVPPLIYAYLRVINDDPDAGYKTLSISLQFFELILNSVAAVILKAFDCKRYGGEHHLKEQLTIQCDFSTNSVRRLWVVYASIMTFVYPLGVPSVMLFVVPSRRHLRRPATLKCARGSRR